MLLGRLPAAALPAADSRAIILARPKASLEITCYNCNKTGYYSRDCKLLRAKHKLVEIGEEEDNELPIEGAFSNNKLGEGLA